MSESGDVRSPTPLKKRLMHMASSSTVSDEYMAGFGKSIICVELISDMASHARLHVSLTAFRCINML